jgi:hypothetical protein
MFAEPNDPTPLTEDIAVLRGIKCVGKISTFFFYGEVLLLTPFLVLSGLSLAEVVACAAALYYGTWLLIFRRWRSWANGGGCDSEELMWLAEDVGFIPVRGTVWWYLQYPAHVP